MAPGVLKLLLLLAAVQQACCLVRLDLSQSAWQLSSSNRSISLPVHLPAHVLGVLAAAGVVQQDPLYRYGELETRWVSQHSWNFTVVWPGQQHAKVAACRHVLLVMHGIDTFGSVLLNGRHVLAADNAHRSWWVVLRDPSLLRQGANMLSVVLQPAVQVALRSKALNAYWIPTMAVPGGFDVYNFARKPASDFGWDWGPAFAPAGLTGGVELLGFDRATIIGALVHQQLVNSSSTFLLTITAQLLVPEAGDCGLLSASLPALGLQHDDQVELQAGQVGGSELQALATITLAVPAAQVRLWQPVGRLATGQRQALYAVVITFQPAAQQNQCKLGTGSSSSTSSSSSSASGGSGCNIGSNTADDVDDDEGCAGGCGVSSVTRRVGFRTVELVRQPIQQTAAELIQKPAAATPDSSSSSSTAKLAAPPSSAGTQPGQSAAAAAAATSYAVANAAAAAASSGTAAQPGSWAQVSGIWQYVRNVSQSPVWWHPQPPPGRDWPLPVSYPMSQYQLSVSDDASASSTDVRETLESGAAGEIGVSGLGDKDRSSRSQQQERPAAAAAGNAANDIDTEQGQSFYFRVNGVPLYAKGANLIPLQVLSSAVRDDDAVGLLQAAAAANMNMVRIWGGGLYQRDALYAAADELGLLVWQEAMFACSPYPRDAAFLSNVEAEVTQQLLRLGSHPSIALWGGNNEIEASLEWYDETRSNLALFAVDYQALFVDTIGRVVQQMVPGVPWVDSSPSNGIIPMSQPHNSAPAAAAAAAATRSAAAATAQIVQQEQVVKRWGNPQNPKYGDVHFYDYKNDCQDWRTYPASRFISEYGWQSYPSWGTYSAATAAQDWAVATDMTEFRQRHPNGTVELLAQMQRRFKLPAPWLQLLHMHSNHQQRQQQQQQQQQETHCQKQHPCSCSRSEGCLLHVWQCWWQKVAWASSSGNLVIGRLQKRVMAWSAKLLPSWWLPAWQTLRLKTSSSSSSSSSVEPNIHIADPPPAASSSSAGSDMQHYIYLTQLQQMLCYETAVSYWRRLRSDAAVQTMGVLYWQLNDIWQGASWSSLDYGGVWKPLHYGLGRWFADLALSVQHDLHNGTIQVYIVSDLQHSVDAQLTVRLLSLADTPDSCGSSSNHKPTRTLQQQLQYGSSSQSAAAAGAVVAAPWAKYSEIVPVTVPPASAVLAWSGSAQQLLAAAAGCSTSTCYVHISLTAAAAAAGEASDIGDVLMQQIQEATVWLAPFPAMELPLPQLQLSDFKFVTITVKPEAYSSKPSSSSSEQAGDMPGEVAFTVSGSRVAAFAVWELTSRQQQQLLPGHFSQNAVTVHPCEPRVVHFVPRLGMSSWESYISRVRQFQQQQQQQQQAGGRRGEVAAGTDSFSGVGDTASSGHLLALLLQQSIAASSLFDHQQFEPSPTVQSGK